MGSQIVKTALEKGYRVHGTMRDANDEAKRPHLMALPGAEERLVLFSSDTSDGASFDAPLEGADAVFIACFPPIYEGYDGTPARELDRERGFEEVVCPVRDGCLNILEAAKRQGVGNALICSSTSSTNPPEPVAVKTEENAVSDAEQQMDEGKFTAAQKIVMERAAGEFCAAHDMRLAIMLPTMMLGPVVLPQHLEGASMAMPARLHRGEKASHERIPNGSMSISHLEDVAKLFLAAYEMPDAQGRYFAVYDSVPWQELYGEISNHVGGDQLPAPLEGEPEEPTRFDFTRRDSLGVKMRDIPTTLRETFEWLESEPFH